jgi:hypothetical protein
MNLSKAPNFFVLLILVILSACNTSPTNQEKPNILSGKAIGYDGGAFTIEAILNNGAASYDVVGKGSIDAEGNFNLELDDPIPVEFIATQTFCGGVNETVDGGIVSTLIVTNGETILGSIGQASTRGILNGSTTIGQVGARMYVTQDKTIVGIGKCVDVNFQYDLRLKKGWNLLFGESTVENERSIVTSSSSSELKWFFIPNSQATSTLQTLKNKVITLVIAR